MDGLSADKYNKNFKIGDMVKITNPLRSTSAFTYKGKIGKILSIYTYPDGLKHCSLDIDERGGGIWLDEIELIKTLDWDE